MANLLLAAMDSEPVAVIDHANLDYLRSGADADVWPPEREEMGDVLLYRHAQPAPVVPDGYVMVPKVPSQAHLNSIAMRYRHDFYLLNDAQKDSALATARQMYEECSGQGFYTLPAAPQEVK
ncbi:hypothetical protein [Klebsiella pneumoniae]|uniref:hypothetical protein n=1 Tax=Klebsiella pneumoniae TaxID=573 RepID=UPI0039C1BB77